MRVGSEPFLETFAVLLEISGSGGFLFVQQFLEPDIFAYEDSGGVRHGGEVEVLGVQKDFGGIQAGRLEFVARAWRFS